MSEFIFINYEISRRKPPLMRTVEFRFGRMRVKGDWKDDALHAKVRKIIHRRHPGWLITGYCLKEPCREL